GYLRFAVRLILGCTNRSCSMRLLGAVLGTPLLRILDACGVEAAAHHVVTHAGQVLDAAATDQYDRVLLQVVSLAADVADDLEAIGQPHLRHLAQSGVRLLGRRGVDARAHAALLRALLERRYLALRLRGHAALAHELVDCWHPVCPLTAGILPGQPLINPQQPRFRAIRGG